MPRRNRKAREVKDPNPHTLAVIAKLGYSRLAEWYPAYSPLELFELEGWPSGGREGPPPAPAG